MFKSDLKERIIMNKSRSYKPSSICRICIYNNFGFCEYRNIQVCSNTGFCPVFEQGMFDETIKEELVELKRARNFNRKR